MKVLSASSLHQGVEHAERSLPTSREREQAQASYKLVISDIDGTLLDSTSTLRPEVIATVDDARHAGIAFTLATGRRYYTTTSLLTALSPTHDEPATIQAPARLHGDAPNAGAQAPVILQTGAIIVTTDGKKVLFRNPLPYGDAQHAIQILIKHGLQPIVYEDHVLHQHLFTGPKEYDTPAAQRYLSSNPDMIVRRPYDQLLLDRAPLQIAVIGDRAPLEATVPYLTLAHCRTIISYSGNLDSYFMEVFHKRCNKGRAAERLANQLGLNLGQTVCIGDNWNDVEMLALAGCGIAVANAEPGVIPYARRIAPSNDENAVAVVLRQIMAGEEPGEPNPLYDPSLREITA